MVDDPVVNQDEGQRRPRGFAFRRRIPVPSPSAAITAGFVAVSTVFVLWNLQLDLVFTDSTPTGGDLGAHVWSPAYLRDVLLPDLRLAGWSPDWYAGFPAFTYYMVVPSVLVVVLDVGLLTAPAAIAVGGVVMVLAGYQLMPRIGPNPSRRAALIVALVLLWALMIALPYGVALKVIAILGVATLPVAAYALGRLGGLAFPGPGLMAVATIPFIFDRSFNIYGGNLMSTMAGEFAFSLGLTMAVVYLGVAARGMNTGRGRGWGALLLALAGLLHLFAAFFALVGSAAYWITRPSERATRWLASVGLLSALLSAFWVLPFFWNRGLLNDMGWGKERRFVAGLWSRSGNFGDQTFLVNDPPMQLIVGLAIAAAVICGLRRVRLGVALSLVAAVFAAVFVLLPEGRLWNVRLLPFYYLTVNLLAAIAVAELSRLMVRLVRRSDIGPGSVLVALPGLAMTAVVVVSFGLPLRSLPFGSTDSQGNYDWFGLESSTRNLGPLWAQHNFEGYEGKGAWPEYSLMVETMDQVGRQHGCGRALWEYESARLGSYGTPMAPMLLPYWTDGCIGSMEGLYFEASATTPYHFLAQSELSAAPSRAQRDLPYSSLAVGQGVSHLQDLGVRYYMAFSEEAVQQAQTDARLTEVARSEPWVVFVVADADLVVGLDHLPVVLDGVSGNGDDWLVPSVAWWEGERVPHLAGSGPQEWPRYEPDQLVEAIPAYGQAVEDGVGRAVEMRALGAGLASVLPTVAVEPAVVTEIRSQRSELSFRVDQVGRPVLVRTSFFPNWTVSGADGPYRVSPNFMVVVPTEETVVMQYRRSPVEWVGLVLTLLGGLGLLNLRRFPVRPSGQAPDLLASPLARFPTRASLLAEARTGGLAVVGVKAVSVSLNRRIRRGGQALGLATLGLALSVLGHRVFQPTSEDALLALAVWLPGALAVGAVVFRILPSLVTLMAYRSMVVTLDEVTDASPSAQGP